jgi:hypothetical protein
VVIMSAETLTYDQIAQRMNLMAAREVTSRLEGEIAGLRSHAKPSCRPWSCSAGHGGPGAGPGELVWPPLLKQLLPDASQPFGQLPPGGFAAAPGAPAGTQ